MSLFIIKIYSLPIDSLAAHPVIMGYSENGWWMLYTLFGVILPLLFAKLVDVLNLSVNKHYEYRQSRKNPD